MFLPCQERENGNLHVHFQASWRSEASTGEMPYGESCVCMYLTLYCLTFCSSQCTMPWQAVSIFTRLPLWSVKIPRQMGKVLAPTFAFWDWGCCCSAALCPLWWGDNVTPTGVGVSWSVEPNISVLTQTSKPVSGLTQSILDLLETKSLGADLT